MPARISPLSQVDPQAQLADDVEVGPFCLIGPHVKLGPGCRLDSHVVLVGHTSIGRDNRFYPNCVIGAEPQDYSYSGAPTRVEIGDSNVFREGVTVHRGAEKEEQVTRIGNHNMLMANCHVAHNCQIRDRVILVNGSLLGGHVHVHEGAIVSGNSVVHHFATLGTLSFVSGGSRVPTDVPPYMLSAGSDAPRVLTINLVGMRRKGIPEATIEIIKRAYRLFFREHKSSDQARAHFVEELGQNFPPELTTLLDFVDRQRTGNHGRAGELRRHETGKPETAKPESRRDSTGQPEAVTEPSTADASRNAHRRVA